MSICLIVLIVLFLGTILIKEIEKKNMGRVIITDGSRLMNLASLHLSITGIFIARFIYSNNRLIVINMIDVLAIILYVTILIFTIYTTFTKYQIRQNGIWTPQYKITWDKVESYKIIDYRKFNECYEGGYYLLKVKIRKFFLNKTWYKDIKLDITEDSIEIVKEFFR